MRSYLRRLCICLTLATVASVARSIDYLVPYEESVQTYVDYPKDNYSQALLKSQHMLNVVRLVVWSTVDDFQHPLFYLVKGIVRRLDSDLLWFEPAYYLADGFDEGCRYLDPFSGNEEENTDQPGCRENCTNHGRYCAASTPKDPALAAKIDGASIVEESLRQLCVWVVYGKTGGDNMLHFFRYVNHVIMEQCEEPFSRNCTSIMMEEIGITQGFIEDCMNHTNGLDSDKENAYLQAQINGARGAGLRRFHVPSLRIENKLYSGEESTAAIFRAVCAAYPAEKQPIACDFCKDCEDVRSCLWHLRCGELTFEGYAEAILNGYPIYTTNNGSNAGALNEPTPAPGSGIDMGPPIVAPAPPPGDAPPPEALFGDNSQKDEPSSNSHTNGSSQDKAAAQKSLISGIFVGLAAGLVVSGVYAFRDWQATLVLKEIMRDYNNTMSTFKDKEPNRDSSSYVSRSNSPDNSVQSFERSAKGIRERLKEIEMIIDGGRDITRLLDDNTERPLRPLPT